MNVLVTGATGFVGRAVVRRLKAEPNVAVRCGVRHPVHLDLCEAVVMGDISGVSAREGWRAALSGIAVVVHLAARVHVMRDAATDSLAEYRRVNTDGTRALAEEAAARGARRFVFLSSVKVNGEDGAFTEADAPAPLDPYGVSKAEAEAALREVARSTGLEVVIVRAPLVYGAGARANFAALLRAVAKGIPLPLAAVRNARSLIAVDNLADFLTRCATDAAAANELFLVSDGAAVSTPELIRAIARALRVRPRLFALPTPLLRAAGFLLRRRDAVARLTGSLTVDISKATKRLRWSPPLTFEEGMQRAVADLPND